MSDRHDSLALLANSVAASVRFTIPTRLSSARHRGRRLAGLAIRLREDDVSIVGGMADTASQVGGSLWLPVPDTTATR
ncbi:MULTISPECIES: hypothetical protein [Amycolatopsis]|uniref:Uncharacterized protein n=1 Tax=Amycolatopsis thermalba TaxID=944492 RepID=A0ABY4NZC5_9PSEU|nr:MULTISPECIES: hypothetical protein [Amycolatopsis]OXM75049.1 hypothetical protein CF166_00110 [Amycolatopsis sp. KNN50.9b]UQS25351.1 hypothetical protein L1857_22345 [Amycolatopsis thermalba]